MCQYWPPPIDGLMAKIQLATKRSSSEDSGPVRLCHHSIQIVVFTGNGFPSTRGRSSPAMGLPSLPSSAVSRFTLEGFQHSSWRPPAVDRAEK
jgi:hypothetical protein